MGFFPAAAVRQVQPGLAIPDEPLHIYIAERAIGTSVMCACPTEIVALTWCSATVRVRGEGLGIVAVGDVQNTRLGSDCHG